LGEAGESKRAWERLTEEERERFLRVLRETGNRKTAAAAIGVEPRLMDQRRKFDPAFDRAWREAVEEADRRLREADGSFACAGGGMIRRGKGGRRQIVSTGEGRWNAAVEARFKEVLRATGNFAAAARAVGFSESAVWDRRRKWPAFAASLDALLDEAEMALEYRLASMGSNLVAGGEGEGGEASGSDAGHGGGRSASPEPFDMDQAMRFLKWREEKRRGGRRTPAAKAPTIEEVTEKVVRQVAAIKRHAEKQAARRQARDEEEGGRDA
jgi:hypothetical protein